MKDKLKQFCNSIGIECVGIADKGPYYELGKILKKRVKDKHNNEFEEKDIKKRIDPTLTLEDAKSVIVCIFPYYIGEVKEKNISNYTFSLDYHKIIKNKLEQIGKFLDKEINNFHYKSFVDTGPLVDRYLAYKAGLGFYGINGHIITDKYGSYIFIGYIINNYPFEVDKPMNKTCMRCGKCIKECLGSAILGNFNINTNKCKSYITQKKGELSEEEKKIIKKSNLVFGCDVCQEVCPHNINIKETNIKEFRENIITKIDYNEILNISNKEFIRRYKERAFAWRGKKIIIRNFEIIKEKV
ncbi:tRNA epoxyqueuosine(34) reductase QueG [Defluviitalea phaphyphila]|uniref:tRNA epoxyqueuosine(34) reductase QueG n=1 Tax=Defluviitalea phaphyphila TaxID=1473580 RepID=UPI000730A211|nr:tRNA epoxyqueuosine(34) reductase QueG [Defluviitalea phaphyphila]